MRARAPNLKEVFVRGCLSRSVPADLRGRWSLWLKQLVHHEGEVVTRELRGEVVRGDACGASSSGCRAGGQSPLVAVVLTHDRHFSVIPGIKATAQIM
jgi:hypothetical protein